MWKRVQPGKKAPKTKSKRGNDKNKKRKKSNPKQNNLTKECQRVCTPANTSEWQSTDENSDVESEQNQSDIEANERPTCSVSSIFLNDLKPANGSYLLNGQHKSDISQSQTHCDQFKNLIENESQNSDIPEQKETSFGIMKNSEETFDTSNQEDISDLSDERDPSPPIFPSSTSTKCVFIATEKEIYVQEKVSKEGQASLRMNNQDNFVESNPSCNDFPKKTHYTEPDPSGFHDNDHSFGSHFPPQIKSKNVFIATDSVIYVQKETGHKNTDATSDIKPDNHNFVGTDSRNSLHHQPTASDYIFVASQNIIYVETKSTYLDKISIERKKESYECVGNSFCNESDIEACNTKPNNSISTKCDDSLAFPVNLSDTEKPVFIEKDDVICLKAESIHDETFVKTAVDSPACEVTTENVLRSKITTNHENLSADHKDIELINDKHFPGMESQKIEKLNAQKSEVELHTDKLSTPSTEIPHGSFEVVMPEVSMSNITKNSVELKPEDLQTDNKDVKIEKGNGSIEEDSQMQKKQSSQMKIESHSKLDSEASNTQINETTPDTKSSTSSCKSETKDVLTGKSISKESRHTQCNLYCYDPRISRFPLKMHSEDQKEYIKRKIRNGNLFYSSQFINKYSQNEIIISVHGPENLLVLNKDNFAARIIAEHKDELNFNKPFQKIKLEFLKNITIMKILEDNLLDRRNESYSRFKEILQDRINKATDHVECTEDLLQLSIICNQTFKKRPWIESTVILNEIIKNKYVSIIVKQYATSLLTNETNLRNRNQCLPIFHKTISLVIKDFLTELNNMFKLGIINHRNNLLKKYSYCKFKFMFQLLDVNYLSDIIILSLNGKDIKLFADLVTIANQQKESPVAIISPEYITNVWNNFYKKIKELPQYESIKQLGSLTNPIYIFLFKSFCELITEISNIIEVSPQDLLKKENEKFTTLSSLKWPENTPIFRAFEEQYRLIFKLMEHFEPGKYSNKRSFKYKLQLGNCQNKSKWQMLKDLFKTQEPGNIPEERLVWLYILDSGLAHIIPKGNANEDIQKLTHSLQKLFVNFLENDKYDRHETFRIVVQNITKLVGHLSTYISTMDSVASDVDRKILDKQIEFISSILINESDDAVISEFSNLMDVYKEYWKNRESIVGKILSKCPCKQFEDVMEKHIFLRLLQIVDEAQSKKVTMQVMIQYFRLYNEFLQHFKGIEFEWLVSEKSLKGILSKSQVKLVNSEKKHYRVTDPEQFITTLKSKNVRLPENYLITVVKELLNTINKSLKKINWTDFEQIKAAGDLFLAIGHSLIHFNQQANYVDFDNFVRSCTLPFSDVIMNSETYADFKTRLDNVENFYLYTNKQNEIGIDSALNLCIENSKLNINQDFVSNINVKILKDCYSKYSNKFSSLEKYFETSDINSVVADMRKDLRDTSPIQEWTPEFKQNVVPSLLANLAAVWTILESKDLARIGKRIEPHIIQILCIFRLLGVDKNSNGIEKHLAQVLTGQGKSIVLGLLSSLLAVTGNKSIIACYSKYLAERDKHAFKNFFNILSEFNVESKVSYQTIESAVNELLCQNINGRKRNLRRLVSDLILDELPAKIIASDRKSESSVLLIDEVDVFFSDTFYGSFYGPVATISIPAFLEIQPKIWEIVEDGVDDKYRVYERIMEFINGLIKDEKYENFKDFIENTNAFFKKHLDEMITTAITVSKSKSNKNSFNYKYKINEDGLISYRNHDGIYVSDTYCGYYNVFNYFFLKETDYDHKFYNNYGYLKVDCGSISYANLPKEFPVILGVSGTITTLHDFEKEAIKSYGINTVSVMPSFFGDRKLKFDPVHDCILKNKESEWLDSIHDNIADKIHHGRAVIVFFKTEYKMNLFEEKYKSGIGRLNKLTGNEESSTMEWYISESGVAQTVTLATRTMGRGVDFKSNDSSVEQKGGVHVIQTFFSLDVKEEVQIQGRTARKDNKGSYQLILCHEHLAKIKCSVKEKGVAVTRYRELCNVRKNIFDKKGTNMEKKIQKASEKHDLTFKFMKSFADYTPSKRLEYISRYPLVDPEDDKQ